MSALRVSTKGSGVRLVDQGEWHVWFRQQEREVVIGGRLVVARDEPRKPHQRPDQEVQR